MARNLRIKDESISHRKAHLILDMIGGGSVTIVPPICLYRDGSAEEMNEKLTVIAATGQITKKDVQALQGSLGKIHLRSAVQSMEWVNLPKKNKQKHK